MSRIRFGWSEVSLVPDRPISLAGEFFERVTSEVETPITVTTLAVEEDGEQAFFCSCDLEGVGRDLCLRVRARVGEKNPKIQTDKIMLHAVLRNGEGNAPKQFPVKARFVASIAA